MIFDPLINSQVKSIIFTVTNLSPEFCRQIKEARRAAKLGQTVVAAQVGCKQAALSMFENGGVTKVNDDVIKKLSELFKVKIITIDEGEEKASAVSKELAALTQEESRPLVRMLPTHGFCPNPNCPSNHVYEVEGRTLLRPDRTAADPVGGKFCALCGEVLEKKCPNCGAPIHDGAICSLCGEAYVVV